MGDVLPSSAEARLRRCCHDLTLDVFTRNGAVWDAIRALRERWNIHATTAIPPYTSWLPFPPSVPEHDFSPEELEDIRPDDWSEEAERWLGDIHDLHDRLIGPSCRVPGGTRGSRGTWSVFLAGCTLYDPPEDQLVAFADLDRPEPRTFISDDTYLEFLAPPVGKERFEDKPYMIGPPIVELRDPDSVYLAWQRYVGELMDKLSQRLRSRGINLSSELNELEGDPQPWKHFGPSFMPSEVRPYIEVMPETTDQDVRHALRLIHAGMGVQKPGGRPPLDPLTAVQCAIYQRLGWTEWQIAEHFDWPLNPDSYDALRRSNVARDHLKLGKQLLAERKYPAE